MRATVIGLAALPVAVAGLTLVAAVVSPDDDQAPAPPPERTTTAPTEATSGSVEDTRGAPPTSGGTAIEGIRPYLTVIDGLSTLPVPAPIPAVLSTLPVPQAELAPLPPETGDSAAPPGAPTGDRTETGAGDDDDRGKIRDLLDRETPLGSSGSEDDTGRATDTDPRLVGPDRMRPDGPPSVVDAPGMERPGSGEVVDEPLEGVPVPIGGDRPPLASPPPLTDPPRVTVPAPDAPPAAGPTHGAPPVAGPTLGESPVAGSPAVDAPVDGVPVEDAPGEDADAPVGDTDVGDLGDDGLPAR